MPYTLMKFLVWALLFAAIGGVIGWLLRSLSVRAQMARLRTAGGDQHELERLRARSAELDAVTAERDRLRMEIADVRGSSAGTLGFASRVDPDALTGATAATPERQDVEATSVGEPEGHDDEPGGGLTTLIPASDDVDDALTSDTAEPSTPDAVDLDAAQTILGRSVTLDDLTVIEGIGPKIAELCAAIGIDSWRSLAESDVVTLRSMLDDAGARFKMHRPESWPQQATLLVEGRWDEFVALTEQLDGGD